MGRLNNINDKTWDGIVAYEFFQDLRRQIFNIVISRDYGEYTIKTPFNFYINLSIWPEEDDVYTSLEYNIHLIDEDGKEIKIINVLGETGVGFWSGECVIGEIDSEIRYIFQKIKEFEIVPPKEKEKKDENLPF